MDKIFIVVLIKDKDDYFESYLEDSFAFTSEEKAKVFLEKQYNQHLKDMATDYGMTLEEIISEDVSHLELNQYVVGTDGGSTYYYGHIKEAVIQ